MEIKKDQLLKELPKFWTSNKLSEFYTQRVWTTLNNEDIDKKASNQHKYIPVTGTYNVFKQDIQNRKLAQALKDVIDNNNNLNEKISLFLSILFQENESIEVVRDENTSQDDVYIDLFALYIIYLIKSDCLDGYHKLDLDDRPQNKLPFQKSSFLFVRAYLKDSIEKAINDNFKRVTKQKQHYIISKNSGDVYCYFAEIIDQFFITDKRYKLLVKLQTPGLIDPSELSISDQQKKKLKETINKTKKKNYFQKESLEDRGYQILREELEQVIYAEYGICKYSELGIFVSASKKGIEEGLKYLNYNESEINNLLSLKEVTKEYIEKNKSKFGKTDSDKTKEYGPLDRITKYPERLNELFQLYTATEKDLKSIVNAFRHYEQHIQTEKPPTIPETSTNEDGEQFSLIDFYIPTDDDMPTQEEKQNIGELEERLGIKLENLQEIIDEAKSQDENANIGYRAIYINHFWIHINKKEDEKEDEKEIKIKRLNQTQLGNILQVKQEDGKVDQCHISRCIKRYLPKQIVEASLLKLRNQNPDLNRNIDKTEAINAIKLCIDDYIKGQAQRDLESFCHNQSLYNPTINPRAILDYLNDQIQKDRPNANIYNESTIIQEYLSQSKQ